jgi:short subunit fatty acid transporter
MMLQYPFYGGIMGIMSGTGLADSISKTFVAVSSAHTLPFWSYICSLIITFFVPSGGGHWAVQGPFVVPAAATLHASMAGSAMAVAMGEQVANMLQPFWGAAGSGDGRYRHPARHGLYCCDVRRDRRDLLPGAVAADMNTGSDPCCGRRVADRPTITLQSS